MEKANYYLSQTLKKFTDVELISWGGSRRWLPLVIPYFLIRSFWILLTKDIDVIHSGDASLSPLTLILKYVFKKPVTATAYGLDVTWRFWPYRRIIPKCLTRLDKVVCISNQTVNECILAGVEEKKIILIPIAVDPDEFYPRQNKEELKDIVSDKYGVDLHDKCVLLSVGRFVKRKGFPWFVENVMPTIIEKRKDIVYLLVGNGALRKGLEEAIVAHNLEDHVFLLGGVGDELLKILYNMADVFAMPNVPVEGDMEGFGIVALEAASSGIPVVASRLEGIRDAIKHGENGFLVEPYDVGGFSDAIVRFLGNDLERENLGKRARQFTIDNFTWDVVAGRYLNVFKSLAADSWEEAYPP